jgi:hypothetical protein
MEGIGDNKTERTVDEEVFVLTVLGSDGQRVHLSQGAPFEVTVGEAVNIKLEHGIQTKARVRPASRRKGSDR